MYGQLVSFHHASHRNRPPTNTRQIVWAYGPNWPTNGEIDIIEGANNAHRNIISAHTTPGCQLGNDVLSMASGVSQTKNCDVGTTNIGCGMVPSSSDTSSYGDTFNAVGGGIYAMQWDDDYIKVWHFDRSSAPADIAAKKPKPESWGKPQAVFGGESCDVKSHFRDMSIVLNINFCGDYGNAVWAADGCSTLAPTCSEWVAKNPAAFANAYWDVNYIDAYVQGAGGSQQPPSTVNISHSGQPSNIPTASFSRLPGSSGSNGTFTRFGGNSSSMANPTAPSSESTTTTTMTTTSSTTVTIGPIPTATFPAPSSKPHPNPANLDDFSYLGCFGSNSDFKSFDKVADSDDMTLEKCTGLCKDKKFAGVFDTSCYCASELDADTRVSTDTCDTECPGDKTQFCGGRVKSQGKLIDDSVNAKANVTLPETTSSAASIAASISATGSPSPSSGSGGGLNPAQGNSTSPDASSSSSAQSAANSAQPMAKGNFTAPEAQDVATPAKFNLTAPEAAPIVSSSSSISQSSSSSAASSSTTDSDADIPEVTVAVYPQPKEQDQQFGKGLSPNSTFTPGMIGNSTLDARSLMYKSVRPGSNERREASKFLLTVYAAVAKEEPPKQPPGMGIHTPNGKAATVVGPSSSESTTNTLVTTVTYTTVHPMRPSEMVEEHYVTTIVQVDCGCTHSTPAPATVPMVTKVVGCSFCGPKGENTVTVTVPHSVTVSHSTTAATVPTAASSGKVPPAYTSPPAEVVAGAAGVKVTSLIFTTMLAMVLLL